ncbi:MULTISPECIES: CHAT domain-containing protein [Spirulina sp. CCY15215]|uniref:CHAT domain-containing protein n=1 Tax=Spirulina sp. CCY15215 TaxID=2767591 RepID=UPI001951326A|nr:CHAT domain-containing protein [Spirulina major]
MKTPIKPQTLVPFVALSLLVTSGETLAQSIVPASDGTGTIVNIDGNEFVIDGGTLSGDGANLFHSFIELGLDANQIATFLSNPQIQNILGRVTGGNPSVIDGLVQVLGGDSNLYLMNPSGFVFGSNASLNVPGDFFATTAQGIGFGNGLWFDAWGDNDYQNLVGTPVEFDLSDRSGVIINAGDLAVSEGQNIGLIGGTVINTGSLSAPAGNVSIVAMPESGRLRIVSGDNVLGFEIEPPRDAQGNLVAVRAVDIPALITRSRVETGLTVAGNEISVQGTNVPVSEGSAIASGELEATGGNVDVLGDIVALIGAEIDVSGSEGGGNVRIGGEKQGAGTMPRSDRVWVDENSTIRADGGSADGGNVIAWADGEMQFLGEVSATGENGGFVEVSGLETLDYRGWVDASGINGEFGTLLLDPTDFVVDGSNVAAINNALANVNLTATQDIFIDEAIAMANAGVGLTVEGDRHVRVNADITTQGGDVQLIGDADNTDGGSLTITNATIQTGGGDFVGRGQGDGTERVGVTVEGSEIDAGGGNIEITGVGGSSQGESGHYGISVNDSVLRSNGTGNIVMNGAGGEGSAIETRGYYDIGNNHGIFLKDHLLELIGTGSITLDGRGGSTGLYNYGIEIQDGLIQSENGNIKITGIGGNGFDSIIGMNGITGEITGNPNIDNRGDHLGRHIGFRCIDCVINILTDGVGEINLVGQGSNEDNYSNNGIEIHNSNFTAGNGGIFLEGQGNEERAYGLGISSSSIETIDNGNIDLRGIGINGAKIRIYQPSIRSKNGNISIRSSNAIDISSAQNTSAIIESTGFGNINLILNGSSEITSSSNLTTNQGKITIISQDIVNNLMGGIRLSEGNLNTNGQDITLLGRSIEVNSIDSSLSNGNGGNITLIAGQDIEINEDINAFGGVNGGDIILYNDASVSVPTEVKGVINSSGGINGGNVFIYNSSSSNTIFAGGTIIPTIKAGEINTSGSQHGGDISIFNSTYSNVELGDIDTSGSESGGNIEIAGRMGTLFTQNIRSDSPKIAGDINITVEGWVGRLFSPVTGEFVSPIINGSLDTTAGVISAAGGVTGGNIALRAVSDIDTGTITLFNPGFQIASGKIEILSLAGNVDTTQGTLITSSALGRGGDIDIISQRFDTTVNSTPFSAGGDVNVADINAQSIADQGGAISITADRAITTQGDITTNDNSLTFDGMVNLADNNTFKVEGNGNITFGSTLDGSHELTLDAQTVTLEDSVGATTPLDRLTVRNGTVFNDTTTTDITVRQDITTSHIDSEQAISLNSLEGRLTTGNLTSTETITLDGNSVTTGNIDAERAVDLTSRMGDLGAGNIATRETLTINTSGDLTTGNINAQNETSLEAQSIETGNITIQDDLALTSTNGDILTQQIDTQGELSISTTNGDLITGNISATDTTNLTADRGSIQTENITVPADVTLISQGEGITTGAIDTSATTDAGNVTLQGDRSISTDSINAQSSNETGGNVTIETPQYFQATDTFSDRNGQNASISVAGAIEGGEVKIYHGGNGEIPFIVGDAATNGTTGEITRGNDIPIQSIETYQEYPYTHKQDSDRLQIVSVPQPHIPAQPQPTSPPLPETSPDPVTTPPPENPEPLEELDRGDNPIESLALLIGDLLNAETTITTDETGDYAFEWQTANPNTGEQVQLSLDVENPYTETDNPETDNPIAIADITPPSLNSLTSLNLNTNPEQIVTDIEQLLETEYETYFGDNLTDREVNAQSIRDTLKTIEIETGTRAVVVYALPFPDSLQLVLVRPEEEPLVTTVADADSRSLFLRLRQFRNTLLDPTNKNYQVHAKKLYQWLIAPIESELERLEIDTLIFSMGAGLRSLPLAALHDGEQFLVEKYSLGTIPSVALTDTRYQSVREARILGMGAEEFHSFSNKPDLPSVPLELAAIVDRPAKGETFLNEEFTLENLRYQRNQSRYDIVHLATHASFQPNNDRNTYIQFWQDKIRLDALREARWYDDATVELLVLSACETAIGDRRSEMGFAGLAVRSGVKSVLASLWKINDFVTLPAIAEFYSQLAREDVTIKAEALRQSQIALLSGQVRVESGQIVGLSQPLPLPPELHHWEGRDLSHPYFWAGYTAIGSPW